jgi:hypothetical protein
VEYNIVGSRNGERDIAGLAAEMRKGITAEGCRFARRCARPVFALTSPHGCRSTLLAS